MVDELNELVKKENALGQQVSAQEQKVGELQRRVAQLPPPSKANEPALAAAREAKEEYLASLKELYDAEKTAGIEAPPAPGDPAAAKGTYGGGVRSKFDARIVGVKQVGDGYHVTFMRGSGADASAWKDETVAVSDVPVELAPGAVASLELVFVGGESPAWRLLKATAK